ncbi:hypothetical protein [Sphaerisporangium sp. NPDC051011]|uniref:hypothetical protein n=1 Tax=Sphaerisporangium sp. NPDC051011 TaxID=3155792 RepID=UPI0033E33576
MMRRLTATSCLVAVLAGCASTSPGTATPSPSPTGAARTLALFKDVAKCLRTHGMPGFPDPTVDPRTGEVGVPDRAAKPGRAALDACRTYIDRLPDKGQGGKPVTAAEMAKLREFSRCMREHGLRDWPDPNPEGAFSLPKRLDDLGKRGLRTQFEACGQYLPGKGVKASSDGARG